MEAEKVIKKVTLNNIIDILKYAKNNPDKFKFVVEDEKVQNVLNIPIINFMNLADEKYLSFELLQQLLNKKTWKSNPGIDEIFNNKPSCDYMISLCDNIVFNGINIKEHDEISFKKYYNEKQNEIGYIYILGSMIGFVLDIVKNIAFICFVIIIADNIRGR